MTFNRVNEQKPPARGGFTHSKRVVPFDALRQIGAARLKHQREFRAALSVFRRKMEAGADKTESQLAEGKHNFLKKVDENFSADVVFNLNENFRAQRWKFTFNLSACGNFNSAKPILSRAARDINSAEGG